MCCKLSLLTGPPTRSRTPMQGQHPKRPWSDRHDEPPCDGRERGPVLGGRKEMRGPSSRGHRSHFLHAESGMQQFSERSCMQHVQNCVQHGARPASLEIPKVQRLSRRRRHLNRGRRKKKKMKRSKRKRELLRSILV